jgi:hypothetical protein
MVFLIDHLRRTIIHPELAMSHESNNRIHTLLYFGLVMPMCRLFESLLF